MQDGCLMRKCRVLALFVCFMAVAGIPTSLSAQTVAEGRRRAQKGDAEAQFQLGARFALGEGVTQSYEEAVRWYRKAARHNHASAQYALGVCYAEGLGVRQSLSKSEKWHRKAAEQGHPLAQHNLNILQNTQNKR